MSRPAKSSRRWYRTLYFVAWIITRVKGFPVYTGRENIPSGGMLICANHTSVRDPMLVMVALTRRNQIHFMAKSEWFDIKLGRIVLGGMGMFPVKRGERDISALKTALGLLHGGENVALFPQGTRKEEGDKGEGKTGAAMLALRTGVPVLPVFIQSPKSRAFKRVRVAIGKPFVPACEGKPSQSDYRRVADEIMDSIWALEEQTK